MGWRERVTVLHRMVREGIPAKVDIYRHVKR